MDPYMYPMVYSPLEVFLFVVSLVINLCTVYFSIKAFLRQRHRFLPFLVFSMLMMTLYQVVQFVVNAFFAPLGNVIGRFIMLGMLYSLLLFFDFLSKDEYDRKKLVAYTIMSTVVVLTQIYRLLVRFWLDRLTFELNPIFNISGTIRDMTVGVLFFLLFFNLCYWFLKLKKNAPDELKRNATGALIGGIILTGGLFLFIFAFAFLQTDITTTYAYLAFLTLYIGFLVIIWQFYKRRELGFVLPYHALRLMVVNVDSGIPIYSYTWDKRLSDEGLFSGMLQGITSILQESVNRGVVKEIILDNAVLIIERHGEFPIAFVLVSSRSTKMIRSALIAFKERFTSEFRVLLENLGNEVSVFSRSDDFINDIFPFLNKT
ncbi:MAG: hypothetical protein ACFFCS_20675 [Candidatus Hodarchaeota archaeon]